MRLQRLGDLGDVFGRVLTVRIGRNDVRLVADVRKARLQRRAFAAVLFVDENRLDIRGRPGEDLRTRGRTVVHQDDTRKTLLQTRKKRKEFLIRIVGRNEDRDIQLPSFFCHGSFLRRSIS